MDYHGRYPHKRGKSETSLQEIPREDPVASAHTGPYPNQFFIVAVWAMVAYFLLNTMVTNLEAGHALVDGSLFVRMVGGWKAVGIICVIIAVAMVITMVWLLTLNYLMRHGTPMVVILIGYGILQVCLVLSPRWILYRVLPDFSPLHGLVLTLQIAVFIMKAHSYIFVNKDEMMAEDRKEKHGGDWRWGDMYRNNPKKGRKRRWRYILSYSLEAIAACFGMYLILTSVLLPTLEEMKDVPILRAIIRLGLPSFAAWFCAYYAIFHSLLSAWSEIVGHPERQAYKEWWTANTWTEFWQRWHYRVHEWVRAHVYIQLRKDLDMSAVGARITSFAVMMALYDFILGTAFRVSMPYGTIYVTIVALIGQVLRSNSAFLFVVWMALIATTATLTMTYAGLLM